MSKEERGKEREGERERGREGEREREVLLEDDIEKRVKRGKGKLERKLNEKREVNHSDLLAVYHLSMCASS